MVTHEEAKFIKERTNAQALTNSTTPTTTKDSSCGTYHRHNTQHPTEQKPLAYRPTQATNNSTCTHYTTTCLHHSPNHTASLPKRPRNRSPPMMITSQSESKPTSTSPHPLNGKNARGTQHKWYRQHLKHSTSKHAHSDGESLSNNAQTN